MTFNTTTLSIRRLFVTFSISDTQQNNALPLCWESQFIYCYAECHYVECCYSECHCALSTQSNSLTILNIRHLWHLKTTLSLHRCLIFDIPIRIYRSYYDHVLLIVAKLGSLRLTKIKILSVVGFALIDKQIKIRLIHPFFEILSSMNCNTALNPSHTIFKITPSFTIGFTIASLHLSEGYRKV
jgi:hypothetical protein